MSPVFFLRRKTVFSAPFCLLGVLHRQWVEPVVFAVVQAMLRVRSPFYKITLK